MSERTCENCAHVDRDFDDPPCAGCLDHSNWAPDGKKPADNRDLAAENATLKARIEEYEAGSSSIISQAQAAEWHTLLVNEETENAALRADIERKDARIRELEAHINEHYTAAATAYIKELEHELERWKAKAERYEKALCPSPDLLFGLIKSIDRIDRAAEPKEREAKDCKGCKWTLDLDRPCAKCERAYPRDPGLADFYERRHRG